MSFFKDLPGIRRRLAAYARFVKIEHTLFSLPLIFAGAIIAGHQWPSVRVAWLIFLAGVAARIFALSANRILDRQIDQRNPRTAARELAAGMLSLTDALLVAGLSLAVYVWSAQQLNSFCLRWSWLPILLFALYPTMKRYTWLAHFGLGLTWAMAPLGGWFAVRPGFENSWPAVSLAAFSFFWIAGFDIIYSTLDEEFDRREGLFSLPARLGAKGALRISSLCHGAAFLCLLILYGTSLGGVGAAFLLIMAGFLLFLEHMLIHDVQLAFFKINVLAGFVVLAMVILGVRQSF